MRVTCSDCTWSGDDEAALPARDIAGRHEIGVLYSNLECPECGSLCYPDDIHESYPYLAADNPVGWALWLTSRLGQDNARAVADRMPEVLDYDKYRLRQTDGTPLTFAQWRKTKPC